jgi:hypothetical protein
MLISQVCLSTGCLYRGSTVVSYTNDTADCVGWTITQRRTSQSPVRCSSSAAILDGHILCIGYGSGMSLLCGGTYMHKEEMPIRRLQYAINLTARANWIARATFSRRYERLCFHDHYIWLLAME